MASSARYSLRVRLAVLIAALSVTTIVGLVAVSWYEARASARAVADARLRSVVGQLGSLFTSSTAQSASQLAALADRPEVRAFAQDPSPARRDTAAALLRGQGMAANQVVAVEIVDRAAGRLLVVGDTASRAAERDVDPATDSLPVGAFRVRDGTVEYPVVAPITIDGEVAGHVVQWRAVQASAAGRDLFNDLIGTDAEMLVGNRDGSLWHDLVGRADGPALSSASLTTPREYEVGSAGVRLGMAQPIGGSEWQVLVALSRDEVMAPAFRFLGRMSGLGLLFVLFGGAAAWVAADHITRPVRELTEAASAVARGDYSTPVPSGRRDEIGLLARGFGDMARRVAEAQRHLEAQVEERTADLTEALGRLERARDLAERANRAKSDFLAKMSHELRTPLNSIIGFSEILIDETFGPLNDKQRRHVGNVHTSGHQLLRLINEVLDLSKVEAGRLDLALERVAAGSVAEEAVAMVGPLATKKELELSVEVAPDLPALLADPGRLRQILVNLLGNAIKFTPEQGSVRVSVRAGPDVDAPSVVFEVADTGLGIAPSDHDRVFEEFEQVATMDPDAEAGTGLGLALVRRFVQLHGGRVELRSALGEGSTFTVTLPVDAAGAAQGRAGSELDRGGDGDVGTSVDGEGESSASGPLVLVVEDEDRAAELLTHHLVGAGYRVSRARSAEEAVAMARTLRPDAVTLDIFLPDADGTEVLARLRKTPETASIPVVVVSVSADSEVGLALGAKEWIVKPASREELTVAVARAVNGEGGEGLRTVLVVDDDPHVRELLDDLLTAKGFRVLLAEGGRRAIELAITRSPDLILLDLTMPDVTGYQVIRELRRTAADHAFRIIVFTELDLSPEEARKLREEVQAIVVKSEGLDALLGELRRVVGHEGAGR